MVECRDIGIVDKGIGCSVYVVECRDIGIVDKGIGCSVYVVLNVGTLV